MAQFIPIDGIDLKIDLEERAFDDPLSGFHPQVIQQYMDAGYNNAPKTKSERDELGLNGEWNGLESSIQFLSVQTSVKGVLRPTRYLIGRAMRDLVEDVGQMPPFPQLYSPNIVGVSLILPVELESQMYLLGQVKGDALGSGQISAAAAGGTVPAEYLKESDPLVDILRDELLEELGIDLSTLNYSNFVYFTDELELGHVGFSAVAEYLCFNDVLTSYIELVTPKILAGENLEVAGLALIPLEDPQSIRENIRIFSVHSNGEVIETFEERELRPYTEALLDEIKKSGVNSLLAHAEM